MKQHIIILGSGIFLTLLLGSCLGNDRKSIDHKTLGDTAFVNTDFKENSIDHHEGMSACDRIDATAIARLYDVSPDLVLIEDLTTSDRYKNSKPSCMFYIKSGEADFQWLRGSITIEKEVDKNEFMGEVAEANGAGKNWKEAWSLKKSMYKSSEWIPNTGMAALWNAKKTRLDIKFKGYTLVIHPLKNLLNEAEKQLNRDYKELALGIARAGGYLNP